MWDSTTGLTSEMSSPILTDDYKVTKTPLSVTLETIQDKALTGFVSVYKVTKRKDVVTFETKEKGLFSPFEVTLLEVTLLCPQLQREYRPA